MSNQGITKAELEAAFKPYRNELRKLRNTVRRLAGDVESVLEARECESESELHSNTDTTSSSEGSPSTTTSTTSSEESLPVTEQPTKIVRKLARSATDLVPPPPPPRSEPVPNKRRDDKKQAGPAKKRNLAK